MRNANLNGCMSTEIQSYGIVNKYDLYFDLNDNFEFFKFYPVFYMAHLLPFVFHTAWKDRGTFWPSSYHHPPPTLSCNVNVLKVKFKCFSMGFNFIHHATLRRNKDGGNYLKQFDWLSRSHEYLV